MKLVFIYPGEVFTTDTSSLDMEFAQGPLL